MWAKPFWKSLNARGAHQGNARPAQEQLIVSVRRLRSSDDRSGFRSGQVDLDRFFVRFAGQNQFRHHVGTTYVGVSEVDLINRVGEGLRHDGKRSADSSKENWRDDFACVTRDGASIYLSERAQGQSETWVWIGVEDVAALHDEYCQSGAVRVQQPTNFPWARCPPHALAPVLG